MRIQRLIGVALILGLAALVGVGLWQTSRPQSARWTAVVAHPERIMGTTCTLAAVTRRGGEAEAERAIAEAEAALRRVEARMSVWLAESGVSRLNAAGAGEEVPLPPDALEVLRAARRANRQTGGAFDVTIAPVIALWRRAAERGVPPKPAEISDARSATGWDMIELREAGAVKRSAAARVDLGGIAKGYAIDRAIQGLQSAGLAGGIVDVGGDVRCFGRPPKGRRWLVEIRDPFGGGILGKLLIECGAVCTSGNYARFTVVGGERYSHVIDPRTGWPADAVPSATVLAADAMTADIWATALSVLGPEGLAVLPEGTEALIVVGDSDEARVICTPRLRGLLQESPDNLTVWEGRKDGPD